MAPYVYVRTRRAHGDTDTHVLSLTIHAGELKGAYGRQPSKKLPGLAAWGSYVEDMGKGPDSSLDSYSE